MVNKKEYMRQESGVSINCVRVVDEYVDLSPQ